MATIKIGGKDIDLPILNLKTIKKIWPLVEGITDSEENLIKLMDVVCAILSIVLERSETPMTADEIEEALLGPEMPLVQDSVMDMLVESGLMQRTAAGGTEPGEARGAAPSTETGTDLLPNSSQPVAAEETGTA